MSRAAVLARSCRALGLKPGATRVEIAEAFRASALRTHPDRGGCPVAFSEMRAARDTLFAALEADARTWTLENLGSVRVSNSGGQSHEDIWRFFAPVLLSTTIAVVVGFRLLYLERTSQPARPGVRAGGNSRVYIRDISGEQGAFTNSTAIDSADRTLNRKTRKLDGS